MARRVPVALTIAGSDPSGGAGLQADLKTFHRHGVYGMSAVTLLTVQNTQAVTAVEFVEPRFLAAQLDAVLSDIPPDAVKTGAIGGAELIAVVAERAARLRCPLVVDPVMVSKHGHALLAEDAVDTLVGGLLPHAFLVTPNPAEAARLAGFPVVDAQSIERAARAIAGFGPLHVLVKGGRLPGVAADLLWSEGKLVRIPVEHIGTTSTHGTGCTLSAAITARLARGEAVEAAVREGCAFVHAAIRSAPGLGRGCGPVDHLAAIAPYGAG
jgi:hydroxymethylpyrimidine/phosphomethylpyrimidine kinase